jgi:hypothetical protein
VKAFWHSDDSALSVYLRGVAWGSAVFYVPELAVRTAASGQAAAMVSSGKEYCFFVSVGWSWNQTGDTSFLGCNAVFTGTQLADSCAVDWLRDPDVIRTSSGTTVGTTGRGLVALSYESPSNKTQIFPTSQKTLYWCVISGFRPGVDEIWPLLRYYVA